MGRGTILPNFLSEATAWLKPHQGLDLLCPLLLTVWIAWWDLKTRRIPNYLTFGTALAGLAVQAALHGWSGLPAGLLGLALGLGLLLPFYLLGGMGAGDVKALAALGAWLGPTQTLYLFIYMAMAGGIIALGVIIYKELWRNQLRQGWHGLLNWVLCQGHAWGSRAVVPVDVKVSRTKGIPYGVAMALGMTYLFWRG
jgi:prepilin peptidase CpaA